MLDTFRGAIPKQAYHQQRSNNRGANTERGALYASGYPGILNRGPR